MCFLIQEIIILELMPQDVMMASNLDGLDLAIISYCL